MDEADDIVQRAATDIAAGSDSVTAAWKAAMSFCRVRTALGSSLPVMERALPLS